VVIIIAILAAIAIPKFMNSNQASREASLHGNLKLVRDAISRFNTDTGLWPMTLNELTLMPGDPSATQGKDSTNHVGNLPAKSLTDPIWSVSRAILRQTQAYLQ